MKAQQRKLSVDTLYKGGMIITLDSGNPIIHNGAIAVSGELIDVIGTVGEVEELVATSERTVDFSGLVLMPGLIDCHNHMFQTIGKTLGDGMTLLPWLSDFMLPLSANIKSEDAISAIRLASLNCVLSGTTTIIDNHYAPVDEATILDAAAAMEELGVRGAVARGIFGPMVKGGRKMNCDPRLFKYSTAEEIEITRACMEAKPKGSLVEVWPMPENTVYLDPDLMIACHELATEFDVAWQAHCSESMFEVEIFKSVHGSRPAKWLHEHGILNHRTTLAHGIWFDDEEVELLGDGRASIIHNPICNQYLASGIIKLGPLINAGANVVLGTDGTAVGGQHMFESMKAAQVLQHLRELDPKSANAELVLCMATRNGARMIDKNVGTLKKDALADFIFLDMTGVHHLPTIKPVCSLTFSTSVGDVRHVVVNGEMIVENGRATKVDQDKIVADALQASQNMVTEAGLQAIAHEWLEPLLH